MGIFSQYVRKYYESGLYCVPCNDLKAPIIGKGWERYSDTPPTEDELSLWESKFSHVDRIGLLVGSASKVVAFDFDYCWPDEPAKQEKMPISKEDFEKDLKHIEKQILMLLPNTPCIKKGKKGWTRFYKWNPNLKNMQADRNTVRLFDFLAWHKQTLIPPSIHSFDVENKTMIAYKWLREPIENCLDYLPEISQEIVEEIHILMSHVKLGKDQSRHGILLRYLLSIISIEDDINKLVDALIAKDVELNEKPYLTDKKHHKIDDAKANAKHWIERILKWKASKPNQLKASADSADAWDYFFDNSFKHIKKDIMSKDVYVKKDDEWILIKSLEKVVRSYADRAGLKRTKTTDELDRWCFEKKDCEFLVDIPEWDNIDRIKIFGESIESPNFNHIEISDILKHWGSNIFRRVETPEHQNRCPILKGGQGLGKDSLIRAMFKSFRPYYDSTTLPGTQKDILEIASRLLIVHIEEFDQTRNIDIGFLKSLITQPSAFFRESYGHSPNKKIMRPSFISTANVDDFLRDPTGNRRFIVIPISHIKWQYPQNESLMIMSQLRHYSVTKEYVSLPEKTERTINSILAEYTPDPIDDSIIDLYETRFSNIHMNTGIGEKLLRDKFLLYSDVLPIILGISKDMNISVRKVLSTLKGRGFSHKDRVGKVRYFMNTNQKNNFIKSLEQ
jgi:hypothetical protein